MNAFMPFFAVGLTFLVATSLTVHSAQMSKADYKARECEGNLDTSVVDRALFNIKRDLAILNKLTTERLRKIPVLVPSTTALQIEDRLNELRDLLPKKQNVERIEVLKNEITELTESVISHPINRELFDTKPNRKEMTKLHIFKYLLSAPKEEVQDRMAFFVAITAQQSGNVKTKGLLNQIRDTLNSLKLLEDRHEDFRVSFDLRRSGKMSGLQTQDLRQNQLRLQRSINGLLEQKLNAAQLPKEIDVLIYKIAARLEKKAQVFDLRVESWEIEKQLNQKRPGTPWRLSVLLDNASSVSGQSAEQIQTTLGFFAKKDNRNHFLNEAALLEIRALETELGETNTLLRALAL